MAQYSRANHNVVGENCLLHSSVPVARLSGLGIPCVAAVDDDIRELEKIRRYHSLLLPAAHDGNLPILLWR